MTRRPSASIVASPVLVGAVTVLVVIVAVVLAYNANKGLPFVPTIDVSVQARNAAAVGRGSEVREGGFRLGFVDSVRPVKLPGGRTGAEVDLKLDGEIGKLPLDTTFTVRPRSPLGLKYLEVARGSAERKAQAGHRFPASQTVIPVQVDEAARAYDSPTREALRRNFEDFGNALAGRGPSLNEAVGNLPRLFALIEPVAGNLADPRTRLGRFFRELGDAAGTIAPIAEIQADLFTRFALTFEALSRDPEALKETTSRSHPAFSAGIRSFPVQRPFLTQSAALAREMRPFTRELRPTLPLINDALETGVPILGRSPPFYRDLRLALRSLEELASDPRTTLGLRGLTANVTTLQPTIRFLGPWQTVCNYWNYWWTFLGEHLTQQGPFGTSQRVLLKSTGSQGNSLGSMGSAEPANGEFYNPATERRGDSAHLHGQAYGASIDNRGRADCESGQRGYMRRLAKFSERRFEIVTDANTPGNQGPTYRGRKRVPKGQTFTRLPGGRGVVRP